MGCSDDESVNQALVDFGIIEGYIGSVHTNQKVAATDGDGHSFPGHANRWDLESFGSIEDGGDDQFDDALRIRINATDFPDDQTYNEVRFLNPEFGQAQGFVGVATRNNRAVIAAGRTNQLLQLLDLRNATGTITLTWDDTVLKDEDLPGEPLDYGRPGLRWTPGSLCPGGRRTGFVQPGLRLRTQRQCSGQQLWRPAEPLSGRLPTGDDGGQNAPSDAQTDEVDGSNAANGRRRRHGTGFWHEPGYGHGRGSRLRLRHPRHGRPSPLLSDQRRHKEAPREGLFCLSVCQLQYSQRRSGIRENSLTLAVTSTRLRASAWPAISTS